MNWVPLQGYEKNVDLSDKPRLLTEEEIEYIVAHMPLVPSADILAAEVNREGVMDFLRDILSESDAFIAPSLIPRLIDVMILAHQRSLVPPGTAVWITAAEAVGGTNTQIALNSFHASGSAKSVSAGIEPIKAIISAKKKLHNESCTIYYKDKTMSYEEVLNSRSYIVGSVVADFVKDYDIDSPENLEQYWWHDPSLFGQDIPKSTKVLRIMLDVTNMFKQHVTIQELADVFNREMYDNKLIAGIIAVHGPVSDGIIDLYPNPEIIREKLPTYSGQKVPESLTELHYLETIVRPELSNIRVKGIAGIRGLYPIISPVWRIVLLQKEKTDVSEEEIERVEGSDNIWSLYLNNYIMRQTGLKPENLAALCELSGITVIGSPANMPNVVVIAMPADAYKTPDQQVVARAGDEYYLRLDRERLSSWKILEGEEENTTFYYEIPSEKIEQTETGWSLIVSGSLNSKETPVIRQQLPSDQIVNNDGKYMMTLVADDVVVFDEEPEVYYYRITEPALLEVIKKVEPSAYVASKIAESKKARNDEIKELTKRISEESEALPEAEKKSIRSQPVEVPKTPLMLASEFVIAETDGSNLKELLALPQLDKTRTICNNAGLIKETLGIEAARAHAAKMLADIISNSGSYVHPAHVLAIAEFNCSRGEWFGTNYAGISRQPGGHLSLATLERAGKVFTQSALHGRKEDVRNVSAAVVMGSRVVIGDGSFDVGMDIVENGVERAVLNEDLFTILDCDDETIALRQKIGGGLTTRINRQCKDQEEEDEGVSMAETLAAIESMKDIGLVGDFDITGVDDSNLLTSFSNVPVGVNKAMDEAMDALSLIAVGIAEPNPLAAILDENFELPKIEPKLVRKLPVAKPKRTLPKSTKPVRVTKAKAPETVETLPTPVTKPKLTEALPEVPIRKLPALSKVKLAQAASAMKKQQVQDVKMIDVGALSKALTGEEKK